ncbi:AfsR/SARP family transcriptional regulator [Nonomuraea turkmeniaca]|uniref:AfsR/SARP family transcriptional regulator n=1 Tax=Nonomuraea turkmeniaca TaxID=103838 RepID=UPI001476B135|nr:BTAD domain-containing putative transcriptional regulator [Nonomuraea turkmeniaca]
MSVEIKILGPWEVAADGAVLNLAGTRRVGVLARLALNVGQVVTTERIVADVWGDSSTSTAGKQLHIVVSKLREALADEVIATVPGGYRLDLPPESVDAHRFSLLVRQARATRDGTTAIGLYERALALWRGAALEGRSQAWAQIEAARLEEERLVSLEDFIDLRMAAGDHHAVVGELTAHIEAHPLRERPRAQLMLALYRAARPAEALAVYQETRRVMVDELGIEPGVTLRRLQRAVLAGDPILDLATGHDVASAPCEVPAKLPADTPAFTARSAEFGWLDKALAVTPPGLPAVAAINGPGGIGKSALAIRAAHAASGRFPDGVLYVDLRGASPGLQPMTPIDALGQLLRALGLDGTAIPSEVEEAAARYRSLAATRRLLIVLDNALDARQVRPLLPAGPTCAVIVTSRQALVSLDGAEHLQLTELDRHDATTLLARIAGPARVQREPGAADQIVRLCGGLPLAIRVAAARLAARPDWTLAYLAERLTDASGRLDTLQHADLEVRAAIAVSHHHLREEPSGHDAAHLFTLLGLLEIPTYTPEVAAALADWSEQHAAAALDHLLDARLLEPAGLDRYRMHDLVRLYAHELAVQDLPEADRATAVRQVLHHYLATTRTAGVLIDPRVGVLLEGLPIDRPGRRLQSPEEANAWIAAEKDNLLSAARQAAGNPADPLTAISLGLGIFRPFYNGGWWSELEGVIDRAIAIAADHGDPANLARTHGVLGILYVRRERPEAAIRQFELALGYWDAVRQTARKTPVYVNLGNAYQRMKCFDKALTAYEEGQALAIEYGQQDLHAIFLMNRGQVYSELGRWSEAIPPTQEALGLMSAEIRPYATGQIVSCLGDAYLGAGRLSEAASSYREAITLLRRSGHVVGESSAIWQLGQTHRKLGNDDEAWECWRESVSMLVRAGLMTAQEAEALLSQDPTGKPAPL